MDIDEGWNPSSMLSPKRLSAIMETVPDGSRKRKISSAECVASGSATNMPASVKRVRTQYAYGATPTEFTNGVLVEHSEFGLPPIMDLKQCYHPTCFAIFDSINIPKCSICVLHYCSRHCSPCSDCGTPICTGCMREGIYSDMTRALLWHGAKAAAAQWSLLVTNMRVLCFECKSKCPVCISPAVRVGICSDCHRTVCESCLVHNAQTDTLWCHVCFARELLSIHECAHTLATIGEYNFPINA